MVTVARFPQEAQIKLYDQLNPDDIDGHTMQGVPSMAEFALLSADNIAQALLNIVGLKLPAPWGWEDEPAALVPGVVGCASCTKQTGAMESLFPELEKGTNTCLDGACYQIKQVAWVNRKAVAASEKLKGMPVALYSSNSWELDHAMKDAGLVVVANYATKTAKKTDPLSIPVLNAKGHIGWRTVEPYYLKDNQGLKELRAVHVDAKKKAPHTKVGKGKGATPAATKTASGKPKLNIGDRMWQKVCTAALPIMDQVTKELETKLRPEMIPGWNTSPGVLIGYMMAVGLDTRAPGCDVDVFDKVATISGELDKDTKHPNNYWMVSTMGEDIPAWMWPDGKKSMKTGAKIDMTLREGIFCHIQGTLHNRMSRGTGNPSTWQVNHLAQARHVSGWWQYDFHGEMMKACMEVKNQYPGTWKKKHTMTALGTCLDLCIEYLCAYAQSGHWEKALAMPPVQRRVNDVAFKELRPAWAKAPVKKKATKKKGTK